MARRRGPSAETRFLRGEVGVDGQATAEDRDAAEVEAAESREDALRGGTYLGRELLTWLLWRSESSEALRELEGEPLSVLFIDRLVVRALTGEVTEIAAKGLAAPYALLVKQVMAGGLLVQQARLQVTLGERVFQLTLDAENLDVRAAKLPNLIAEEEEERLEERLHLAELLSRCVDALVDSFLALRTGPAWKRSEVPQLQAWLRGEPGRPASRCCRPPRAASAGVERAARRDTCSAQVPAGRALRHSRGAPRAGRSS
jgi:hypothetical protein